MGSIAEQVQRILNGEKVEEVQEIEKAIYNRDSLGRFTFGKLAPDTGNSFSSSNKNSKDVIQIKRLNIANIAPPIENIQPLHITRKNYVTEIQNAYKKIDPLLKNGGIPCTALNVSVTKVNKKHEYKKNGKIRPFNEIIKHAPYIPFIVPVLKTGICDRSLDRAMSDGSPSHEIIGRAEIIENGIKKRIGISVVLAEDSDSQIYTKISVFRLDDKNGIVKSLLITAPSKNCSKKNLHKDFTTSKRNLNILSNNTLVNKSVTITIKDITEGNRLEKFEQLKKCLNGEKPDFIPADDTKRLRPIDLTLKNCSELTIEKALRAMAMTFAVPLKSAKGEVFFYKAQEDLTDKWCMFFSELVKDTYDFVTEYFDMPKKTIMSKANLKYKGKILYNPQTGEPIKKADWDKFVNILEKFLNRNTQNAAKKIILDSKSLAKILDRMLKYNTLEAVKKLRLEDLSYHGKSFDWISDSVKNMKDTFGESFTRQEQARIEVLTQSAAQEVTNVTDKMRNNIKQILIDGVKSRKSKSQVSQDLFDKMVGDNRDYQRLADTEIQSSFNNSFVKEEVYKTPENQKTYFQRIEVIDHNTCPFCKKMNGKIAVWSDTPQKDDVSKDSKADFVIWEGKEWSGKEHTVAIGVFHPWCRGVWTRYNVDSDNAVIDALVAARSGDAKKWNNAVKQAKDEFKEKGIEAPDDSTKGFTERINELYNGENVEKSLTWSGHKLQDRTTFNGLNISIENKKGSVRSGVDSDGHKWSIKMNYDYGYIRGTEGVDGDHVDCYLGDNLNAKNVYIIHQKIPGTDTYDEDKCMLGFKTLEEAKAAYLKQYDKPGFFGGVDTVPFEEFKEKVLMKKWHGKKLLLN